MREVHIVSDFDVMSRMLNTLPIDQLAVADINNVSDALGTESSLAARRAIIDTLYQFHW